jgi:hypothetical protein
MPIVLVSEAVVLLDLEKSECMMSVFEIPDLSIVVTDLLYAKELAYFGGPALVSAGLQVAVLNADEMSAANLLHRSETSLSTCDAMSLVLASSREWPMAVSHGVLRETARAKGLLTRDVIWLMDMLAANGILSPVQLHRGLTLLSSRPRCNLPSSIVQNRLMRWSNRPAPGANRRVATRFGGPG